MVKGTIRGCTKLKRCNLRRAFPLMLFTVRYSKNTTVLHSTWTLCKQNRVTAKQSDRFAASLGHETGTLSRNSMVSFEEIFFYKYWNLRTKVSSDDSFEKRKKKKKTLV